VKLTIVLKGGDEGRRWCLELSGGVLGAKMGEDWVPNGTCGRRQCS
jgi:hypothetical protein